MSMCYTWRAGYSFNSWEWLPSSAPGPSSLLPSQCLGEGKNAWQYFPCATARPASNLTTWHISACFKVIVGVQLLASKALLKGLDWTEFGLWELYGLCLKDSVHSEMNDNFYIPMKRITKPFSGLFYANPSVRITKVGVSLTNILHWAQDIKPSILPKTFYLVVGQVFCFCF
jgi:hypothetical protein